MMKRSCNSIPWVCSLNWVLKLERKLKPYGVKVPTLMIFSIYDEIELVELAQMKLWTPEFQIADGDGEIEAEAETKN